MSNKTGLLRTFIRQNKFTNFLPVVVQTHRSEQNYDQHKTGSNNFKRYRNISAAALFGFFGSAVGEDTDNCNKNKTKNDGQKGDLPFEAGQTKPGLPTYRAEEVLQHDSKESFWVTYKSGVYDVTKFLSTHPGGEQILNAAGLSIEPFWNVYGMHHTKQIYELLESYRIGNLHPDDVMEDSGQELWAREPGRDPRLLVKTRRPFNAEIPPPCQILHFDTPNELFYVRQHMPVPEVDAATHRLHVTVVGKQTKETSFSLKQLQKFPRHKVRAALMCAGNRRTEMNKVKPVRGLDWGGGAISNAVWEGARLRDVLLHCGVDEHDVEGKHVIFEGSDIDATGVNFSTSIPLHMAMDPAAHVLLATHMNGQPLPPDHGQPLRAVVPGAPAVRSVKWLQSITISTEESSGHWHTHDYRAFNPSVTWETADFAAAPPLYSLPVTSAVCWPLDGDTVTVADAHIHVKGYAYSGGGAKILRVDVSADGGRSWLQATPTAADPAPPRQHYAWTLWSVAIPVHTDQKQLEIWVKATDSNFNTQPEKFDDIWNIRGILGNAYHKIKVNLKH